MDKNTILYDIPDCEIDFSGSELSLLIAEAGYIDCARTVINQNNWWGLTYGDLLEILE